MATNEIGTCNLPMWQRLGLPGKPVVREYLGKDVEVDPEHIVKGLDGKTIFMTADRQAADQAAELLSDHLGRDMRIAWFLLDENSYAHVYAFTLNPILVHNALPLPERAAVAAIAYHYNHFRAGLRLDTPLCLPKILRDNDDESAVQSEIGSFKKEDRAYMLAAVCEQCFGVKAEVVDDADGWLVMVDDMDCEPIDAPRLAMLHGACRVIQDFAISPADFANICDIVEAPDMRQAWKQRRHRDRTAIHDKLDAILARLGNQQGASSESGCTAPTSCGEATNNSKRASGVNKSSGKKRTATKASA